MTPGEYLTSTYISTTSREYAIYVNSNRAIPNVQDGLKHVQRIALWLLARRAEKIKTVALGGLMSAERLYVHGDVSANNAIGMLAAPFRNNTMLVEAWASSARASPRSRASARRATPRSAAPRPPKRSSTPTSTSCRCARTTTARTVSPSTSCP